LEIELNTNVIVNIICFGVGALSIYLTAYLKVKGKNKALKEDIHKLEDESAFSVLSA